MKSIEISTNKQVLGFTLVEMMVVLVIAAILIAVAVPSFNAVTRKNSVESIQSVISSAIATARTEAASRNKFVTICALDAAAADEACEDGTAGAWTSGWIVFEDNNNDQILDLDDNEEIIDYYQHYADGFAITVDVTTNNDDFKDAITFNPQGFVSEARNYFLKICDEKNDLFSTRGVFVNSSGLVIKSRDTDDDGIHNNPFDGNNNIACP